jgi:hypothetical protein
MCILLSRLHRQSGKASHSKNQEMAAVTSDTSMYALGFSLGLELSCNAKSTRD